MTPIALHLFDSGTLTVQGVEVPVPFFLIRHPDGDVVVDGGNPLPVAHDAEGYWGATANQFVVNMTPEQHCETQIRAAGVDPASVKHIVQTHLHIDHTGALGHFPDATVVVHADELASARGEHPRRRGYIPADLEHPGLEFDTYNGERDLFGDGTMRLVPSPGHAAGHISVLLKLENTGYVLLTADASDSKAIWDGRMPPRALHDEAQATTSLQSLHEVADEHDALLIFGHDARNWASLEPSYD
jgi:N-acyl homoserine lactone hydrolase